MKLSFTPGLSPVLLGQKMSVNRFSGLSRCQNAELSEEMNTFTQTVETVLLIFRERVTRLKPGENETDSDF